MSYPVWEHLIEELSGDLQHHRKTLRELGQQGWELVQIDRGKAYFKRRPAQSQKALFFGEGGCISDK